jgi:hypothetical protein
MRLRRILAALMILLLLAPELPARASRNSDWDKVKKLQSGAYVEILLLSGENLSGNVEDVTDATLQIVTSGRGSYASPSSPGGSTSWLRELDRAGIRRIVTIRRPYLPDSRKWMVSGAVAGGAIGLTAGAVQDAQHGGNYHWFEGAAGGAVLGFAVSVAALGAVLAVSTARGPHHRKIIYENNSNAAPRAS